jgi:hypothetical protein
MARCGVPREPRIMQMDWKALGYNAKWEDGTVVWDKDTEYAE